MTPPRLPPRLLGPLFASCLPSCVASSDAESATGDPTTLTTASSTATASTEGTAGSSEAGSTSADPSSDGSEGSTAAADGTSESEGGSEHGAESSSESGAACGDVASDPMNCGACGTVCDAPSFAAPSCTAGACGVECMAGYDEVDVGGATRCSKFAGFFLLRETGTCEAVNPFTGDCTCPPGFDDRPVSSWRIAPADGASWVQLAACSPVAETATDAWGGLFAEYEDGGACAFPNPFHVPLCLCPDGYTVTSQWRGANINGDAIRISFCSQGAFEDDALFVGGFTQTADGGCATGDCACPGGATRVDYPTVFAGAATTSSFCYAG